MIAIHFPVTAALFPRFADALTPGSCLLIETVGGQGGNYLELPRKAQLKGSLSRAFDLVVYHERKVGPQSVDAVSVRLIATKRA